MRILVTGASGFVGHHLVTELIARNHEVVALARNRERASAADWYSRVEFIAADIADLRATSVSLDKVGPLDAVAHLAWSGLPNYKDVFHFETNLPESYRFLKMMTERGVEHILVTGTCFEYGMQDGCLSEAIQTQPTNSYGLAKDCLRRFLERLQATAAFHLTWARLFYMYGPGQNPKSLLSQLQLATERGDREFPMSGGEQLRDFSPVERVASSLCDLLESNRHNGIVNVCSGRPTSVRKLVEEWLASRDKQIILCLGRYPYPDYEPMAFWGDARKLNDVLTAKTE